MTPLFFLDRNALSIIKGTLLHKVLKEPKKTDFRWALAALNQKGHHITSLVATIEGEHGREETVEEKEQCVRNDAAAVRAFFKDKGAITDADQLEAQAAVFAQVFTTYRETGWDMREAYWEDAAPLVKGGVAKKQRRAMEDQLTALALTHGMESQDPIHLLMLAALHGSVSAADALKLNSKRGAYNPLSDLHVLTRLAMVQAVGVPLGRMIIPVLVSMDEGLVDVIANTRFKESALMPDGTLHMRLGFGPALYPGLDEEEYDALMARMIPKVPDEVEA